LPASEDVMQNVWQIGNSKIESQYENYAMKQDYSMTNFESSSLDG
jgi:hypothetical protein